MSPGPGIVRLAAADTPLILWNRTLDKAREVVKDYPNVTVLEHDFESLKADLQA